MDFPGSLALSSYLRRWLGDFLSWTLYYFGNSLSVIGAWKSVLRTEWLQISVSQGGNSLLETFNGWLDYTFLSDLIG